MKCFANVNLTTCSILEEKQCHNCSFRKTKEQLEKERNKAIKRIDSLDKKKRLHIYGKYFKGE